VARLYPTDESIDVPYSDQYHSEVAAASCKCFVGVQSNIKLEKGKLNGCYRRRPTDIECELHLSLSVSILSLKY
jgi:hypothetical protein